METLYIDLDRNTKFSRSSLLINGGFQHIEGSTYGSFTVIKIQNIFTVRKLELETVPD
jgi:hypothetical protein